ncbi:pancreatic lipase-related protein 2 isoform X2 [Stomoxys calcitrans]|uniref:pancreatic lipase-related protein 2 isoform X2 n=1 Tax=Stomoxys calcitrans TaxID=35570 RepID=UPI0027E365D1|nr:pancreatic lipase-related protein 2 isoform X2 [Stomoxys calcitrans]
MALPATSALCSIFTLLIAGSPIFYSPTPRGFCSNCCEIKERDDIKFMLYTRKNPFKAQNLYLSDDKRLRKSNFNFNYPLVIYLHGFSESATGERQSSQEIKDAFLKTGNYNVILIDWSAMTAVPWYANAVENLPVAARYMARFIRFLVQKGFAAKNMHLIGFSLGAEVSGFIGKQLQEWSILLPRITGLDPALPLFEDGSVNRRLSPSDAQFVDIIHTDGGILGNPEAMGHVDFYPNGGHALQPGCARQEIANNRWLGILSCSHQRAWEYFIESVHYPMAFPANRCEPSKLFGTCRDGGNGKAFMGYGADKRLRGKFFLDTNGEPPYGRNTLGGPSAYRKAASLTLLPLQWQLQQQQQQKQQQKQPNNNVTTQSVQQNDTLIDVVVTISAPILTTTKAPKTTTTTTLSSAKETTKGKNVAATGIGPSEPVIGGTSGSGSKTNLAR